MSHVISSHGDAWSMGSIVKSHDNYTLLVGDNQITRHMSNMWSSDRLFESRDWLG